MEAKTKMRSWMVALSVVVVGACARVVPEDPELDNDEVSSDDDTDSRIRLLESALRDERGDRIEFQPSGPVHEHAGALVDLGASQCPAVYKYGYLMDGGFGTETTPNPLAWRFSVDAATTPNVRVRNATDRTVLDWTELPPPMDGTYTLDLTTRGGRLIVAALAEVSGTYYVDVRVEHDGTEEMKTWCFEYHALRAPLHVTPIVEDELETWSFASDSPISRVLGGTPAPRLASQRITQYSSESVDVAWTVPSPGIRYSKLPVTDVVVDVRTSEVVCGWQYTPHGICSRQPVAVVEPTDTGTSGSSSASIGLSLIDEQTAETVATSTSTSLVWTIPARAPYEPPRSYRLVAILNSVRELGPQDGGDPYGEYVHLGLGYTGRPPVLLGDECRQWSTTTDGTCVRWARYWNVEALDHARVEVDPLTLTMTVGGTWTRPYAPPHVPSSALALGATIWDAGDEDVPGSAH
jgi:hypothetical protein